jgi:F0F1-type ATP synthase delta subunit
MQSIMRHENPIKYPAISANLRALAVENQVDLRDQDACQKLLSELEKLKNDAPSVHISFPVDPSPEVVQKLVQWLRNEVDPRIIIQIGLQPSIAAGIVMRTPNHQFDFSLRRHLYHNRGKLMEALNA